MLASLGFLASHFEQIGDASSVGVGCLPKELQSHLSHLLTCSIHHQVHACNMMGADNGTPGSNLAVATATEETGKLDEPSPAKDVLVTKSSVETEEKESATVSVDNSENNDENEEGKDTEDLNDDPPKTFPQKVGCTECGV